MPEECLDRSSASTVSVACQGQIFACSIGGCLSVCRYVCCRLSSVTCYQFPVSSYSCQLAVGNWQLPVSCLPAIKTHCQSIDLYEIGAHVWFANSCHLVIIKSASVAARAQTCLRLWLRFCCMHHFTGNLILILFTDHLAKCFLFIFIYLFVFCLCQRVTEFGCRPR